MDIIQVYQNFLDERLVEDRHIKPHVIIFTPEDNMVIPLEEHFNQDIPKHVIIDAIAQIAGDKHSHKVMLITEVWAYESNDNEDVNDFNDKIENDEIEKQEGYQIVEITRFNIKMVFREFIRTNDSLISLGDVHHTDNILQSAYKCVQDNLISTM